MSKRTTTTTDDNGYDRLFRSLLWRLRPCHLQWEVDKLSTALVERAALVSSASVAFMQIYGLERNRVMDRLLALRQTSRSDGCGTEPAASRHALSRLTTLLEHELAEPPPLHGPDFQCDAGLGGLARWLRACGYDARWRPGIDDDGLLTNVARSGSILLTNDTRLARRGVLVDGVLPSLLVPISMKKRQQLAYVVVQLDLPIRAPRCMACSGVLGEVEKHTVRDRIPPRTFPWRDQYWVCGNCDKLYWEGTHWERIADTLNRCAAAERGGDTRGVNL